MKFNNVYYFLSNKIGGTYTKPLLLPPEVAIGGFGRILVCITVYNVSHSYNHAKTQLSWTSL